MSIPKESKVKSFNYNLILTQIKYFILVAIQCLSETFGLNESLISSLSVPNLASLILKGSSSSTLVIDTVEADRQKLLGNEFINAYEFEKAIECYTKAIQHDPHNAIYFSNRAVTYSKIGEHFKALEDAKESIKLNPSYYKAYKRLGNAHLALGEPEEAVVAFEKALELNPNDVNTKTRLEAARRAVSSDDIEELSAMEPQSNSPRSSMPNLGGGFDIASMLSNPQFKSMAQQMMQSGALGDMLKDPKTMEMMNGMMSDPEMLKKFTGGK